jgi:hypothetical protein
MNKGFWISIGLLVLLAAALLGLRSLYNPIIAKDTGSAIIDTDTNIKLMMDLESFTGFHHDASLLLEQLTFLETDLEAALTAKDSDLLGTTVNNTYRVMDNVNANRAPTIAPFEVCDEALNSLSAYAIGSKTYYTNADKIDVEQVNALRETFDTKFAQCQSMVNDKPVEALYQDYQ